MFFSQPKENIFTSFQCALVSYKLKVVSVLNSASQRNYNTYYQYLELHDHFIKYYTYIEQYTSIKYQNFKPF
jgi:hypothetical protein